MQPIPDVTVPAPIPDADLAQILTLIAQLETLLAPYLRSLTDKQRLGLAKMGADSVSFVQNAENAINYSTDYMARDFDEVVFKHAFALSQQLAELHQRLEVLSRGTGDADMLFGSIAYTDALEIYGALGPASRKDSGLLGFYNAMKERFAKLRGKRDPQA